MKQYEKTAIKSGAFMPYGDYIPVTIINAKTKKKEVIYMTEQAMNMLELQDFGFSVGQRQAKEVDPAELVKAIQVIYSVKGDVDKITDDQTGYTAKTLEYIRNSAFYAKKIAGLLNGNKIAEAKAMFNALPAYAKGGKGKRSWIIEILKIANGLKNLDKLTA
ncbi:MAG: hypothetical protein PHY56_06295 [Candidatus Omnitrophica bacterium]|nr:hypothetical protein [Candidatus Omnitrophota bacterium]